MPLKPAEFSRQHQPLFFFQCYQEGCDPDAVECPLRHTMEHRMLPSESEITICFAHVAYRLQERFAALETGIASFAVRDAEGLDRRVGEADVLVVSGLWRNGLLDRAAKLRFIQSIGAGTDQFPREELARR